jgi:dUTP pyrophosphatase
MKIKRTNINSHLPTRGSKYAAGYDLYSCTNLILYPKERRLVNTGIILEIPDGYYGRIAPRSGLALKQGIDVLAGVIDSDYRGEIGVILYNTDNNMPFHIKAGDRIAQIIFEKCFYFVFEEESKVEDSIRGSGGFGSTGV